MIAAFTRGDQASRLIVDMSALARAKAMDSPYDVNSEAFAAEFVTNDPDALGRVLFDHVSNDRRDVISHKIRV